VPNILVIGFDPHTIPGFDPAPVAAGIERSSRQFAELGLAEDLFLIDFAELGGAAEAKLLEKLRQKQYDAVVVGGGVRKGPGLLELFQTVVNLVHWHQPDAAIAFNDNAGDSPDWVLKALEQRRGRHVD
jgi:phosphoribosylformimino-5-aminoimidazole carboxamide ribonucleotide (ProFAR) isomerase